MSNYDEAKTLLNDYPEHSHRTTESLMTRASALATLALADEMRASRESSVVVEMPRYVYALKRLVPGWDRPEVVSVYLDESVALEEAENLTEAGKLQGGVVWSVEMMVFRS